MSPSKFEKIYTLLAEKRTKVMGILNVTPDSFTHDGIFEKGEEAVPKALKIAQKFIEQGVDIIDIGGESTRPGSIFVDKDHELKRVIPVIQAIGNRFSVPLSIDTTKSEIALEALNVGVTLINDVSGLLLDPRMGEVVAQSGVPVVVMHSQLAQTIHQSDSPAPTNKSEGDITTCVANDLERLAVYFISWGINPRQIIIDPGIGFGKTPLQNLELIKNLHRLKALGYPVLLGASRKSFIGHLTGVPVEERLAASLASVTIASLQGVDFVRVHDVAESKQVIKLIEAT